LISGADGTAIGTGNQNTADILAGCSETNIAAYLCDTLTLGGYNDWFLPSKDELNKLYQNIGQGNALGLGNVGVFVNSKYWSSTEDDSYGLAWRQDFSSSSQYAFLKSDNANVRAVRTFSNDSIITDADGNVYSSVTIGTQEWMSENLRTTKYSDGTTIPNVTNGSQWFGLETGAWSHYDNDNQYDSIYGKLYNWYAVETGKLCPTGWHVPTDAEWTVLTNYLAANGHSGTEGTALKATSGWNDKDNGTSGNGTDDYGWNGLPGGENLGSSFNYIEDTGSWWSSSESSASYVFSRKLHNDGDGVHRAGHYMPDGYSVRCLRD
jgi:uncharacterized protein (TIGR02145 family)